MRAVRYSKSFHDGLAELLEQGVDRFGPRVVAQKRELVLQAITVVLANSPKRSIDPTLGFCAYHVATTPFVVIYDFDDEESRVYLAIHAASDRSMIDLGAVRW